MKLLITGGAGFIGLNFINYTLAHHPEEEITCLDALTYAANVAEIKALEGKGKITFFKGDIADEKAMDALFSRHPFDAVINFAAETHVDRSLTNPTLFKSTNVHGTEVLLNMCLKYRIPRFHQVSTDEVYGPAAPNGDENYAADEGAALQPTSPYAASKAEADKLVDTYYKKYGLYTTISRSSNNFGPYQYPEKLIPLVISRTLEGKKIPVYGTGSNRRNWLYVADNCAATDAVLRRGSKGETYNICSDFSCTNLQLIYDILDKLNKSRALLCFTGGRPCHDFEYKINCEKIKTELKWREETPFSAGLKNTIAWYLEHSENLLKTTSSAEYRAYFKTTYGFD